MQMRASDILLPYRPFIRRSMRKEQAELRSDVDAYQLEHNRVVARCAAEIEHAIADKDNNFKNAIAVLSGELEKDKEFFDAVRAGVIKYADLYFV